MRWIISSFQGAFLKSAQVCHADEYSWLENLYGSSGFSDQSSKQAQKGQKMSAAGLANNNNASNGISKKGTEGTTKVTLLSPVATIGP